MALVKVKPTSAGRRALIKVVNHDLHKGAPIASLVESQKRGSGRNNHGHITTRHKGGGHKQHYRIVDFRRNKDGVTAKVERLEYDPNRSANIALLLYADGERRYIIAPRGVAVGAQLMSGTEAPIKPGNTLALRNIPVGTTVHCVEMQPGKGAQIARSAGAAVLSDPVEFDVPELGDLAVSLFVPAGATGPATWHFEGLQTSYISPPGDFTASTAMPS